MKIDEHNAQFIQEIRELKGKPWINILILGNVGTGKTYLIRQLFPDFQFFREVDFKQAITANKATLLPTGTNATLEMITKHYPLEGLARMPEIIYDDI